jgi:3D (Asp-Asp-Asp) domain-containing protein
MKLLLCLLLIALIVPQSAQAKTYILTNGNQNIAWTQTQNPVCEPDLLRLPLPEPPLPDVIVTREETYSTTIPHATTYCADAALPEGTEEVHIAGRDGELLSTARVTYVNGKETKREILNQRQTIAPITEVIGRGTAPVREETPRTMPVIEDGYIIMPSGEILTYYKTDYVTATGYTHTDVGCDLITSTGTTVHYGTVAVDPRFIPYGTRMLIVSHDGERYYGIATAEDCGGAIKRDRMDLYFPTYQECIEFGRRRCTIYFLG